MLSLILSLHSSFQISVIVIRPFPARVAVVYAFANWPQSIEVGSFLILLVGQVSSLGWNRYIEDALNTQTAARGRSIVLTEALLDKVPDLGGVVAAAWGAWMPAQACKNTSGNSFQGKHDPLYYGIGASIFAGLAALLSLTMLCKLAKRCEPDRPKSNDLSQVSRLVQLVV